MKWEPHVTVATIAEQNGRFLLVREKIHGHEVYNQPAGHWEQGETLTEAAIRETLEETGWHFEAKGIVGIYQWSVPGNPLTFFRVCYHGEATRHEPDRELDTGILAAEWLTAEELARYPDKLRSPMVMQCIDDYLTGKRYPLELITSLDP